MENNEMYNNEHPPLNTQNVVAPQTPNQRSSVIITVMRPTLWQRLQNNSIAQILTGAVRAYARLLRLAFMIVFCYTILNHLIVTNVAIANDFPAIVRILDQMELLIEYASNFVENNLQFFNKFIKEYVEPHAQTNEAFNNLLQMFFG